MALTALTTLPTFVALSTFAALAAFVTLAAIVRLMPFAATMRLMSLLVLAAFPRSVVPTPLARVAGFFARMTARGCIAM